MSGHVRAQTFDLCAWKSVARGRICEARAESTAVLVDVACDAAGVEAVAVEDEAAVCE
jgi:hypothetical protein